MDKKSFASSKIIDSKIDEILKIAKEEDGTICYRRIKHSIDLPITENDLMPSFIEYNNGEAPSDEKQEKLKIDLFGCSVYKTEEDLNEMIKTVTSLRKPSYFNAKGVIDSRKGCVSEPECNGHFQYFLYNPFGNNPYTDFSAIKKEDHKE